MMAASVTAAVAPAPQLTSDALLSPKEAAAFYEAACRSDGVFIHSTFLKQLLLGSVMIEFENGYLGGSGIVPIVRTLQRAPLRALLLAKCALSVEDIKIICAAFAQHPQLEKIDVRGVPLTIGGAKELLHLVSRNPLITEVLMDDALPKFVAIQQQCNRNAEAAYRMNECVICGAGVPSTAGTSCETQVIRFVLEHLKPTEHAVSVAGLRVLCGALQQCMDRNSGILAVCIGVCAESLAEDLCRCVSSVLKALLWQMPFEAPNLLFLRAYLTREHSRLQAEADQEKQQHSDSSSGAAPLPSLLVPGPTDAAREERWRSKQARTDIDAFFDDNRSTQLPRCTVCGNPSECSQDGPTWLLRVLMTDIVEHHALVTPVALVRICRLFTTYANVQPCSRRCVRHLVRYALFGYGGVVCTCASGYPPLSSVIGGLGELQRLPLVDFSVIDVEREVVEDVCGEEINCALTVASCLGDEEGVAMDPYLLFAIGRQLRQQPLRSLGMDLASACEAARLVGCLPVSDAPYKRRGGAAPRDVVADWAAWSSRSGEAKTQRWLHRAFGHRRQRICVVDGPHHDIFDQIRAALWTLRHLGRSILVTIKFAVAWLSLPRGVIGPDASAHTHGFYTTAKVVGQTTADSTVYLILQCPLGPSTGHKGFFYLSKSIFLQTVQGMAFVFVDAVGPEYRAAAVPSPVYGCELVGAAVGVASPATLHLVRRVLMWMMVLGLEARGDARTVWTPTVQSCDVSALRQLFTDAQLPVSLRVLRNLLESRSAMAVAARLAARRSGGDHGQFSRSVAVRTYWERVLQSSRYPSQMLYFISEVCASQDGVEWLQSALRAAEAIVAPSTPTSMAGRVSCSLSVRHGLEYAPLPPSGLLEHRWISTLAASSQKVEATLLEPRAPAHFVDDAAALANTAPRPSTSRLTDRTPSPPTSKQRQRSASPSRKNDKRSRTNSNAPSRSNASGANSTAPAASESAKPPGKTPKPPARVSSSDRRKRPAGKSPSVSASSTGPRQRNSEKVTSAGSTRSPRDKSPEGMAPGDRKRSVAQRPSSSPLLPSDGAAPGSPMNRVRTQLNRMWAEERANLQGVFRAAAKVGFIELVRALPLPESSAVVERAASGSPTKRSARGRDHLVARPLAQSDGTDAIPRRLLGKSWIAVPFPGRCAFACDAPAPAATTEALLLFIGDTVTAYSLAESRMVCAPVVMAEDPVLCDFPFRTGIDAAAPYPGQPHLVFFFSGTEWLLFDLHLAECVEGPYAMRRHGQFRRLPALFHDRIDGVLPVPETNLLVFFRDFCYTAFDVGQRRCVGGLGYLNPPARQALADTARAAALAAGDYASAGMPPALAELIRTLHPDLVEGQGDSSANGRAAADSDADDEVAAADGARTLGTALPPLLLGKDLQGLLKTPPTSAFAVRDGRTEESSETYYFMVSRTGAVVPVLWESLPEDAEPAAAATASEKDLWRSAQPAQRRVVSVRGAADTFTQAPLQNLPLIFRQYTSTAFASLCALAVQTECTMRQDASAVAPAPVTAPQLQVFDAEAQRCGGDGASFLSHAQSFRGGGGDAAARASKSASTVALSPPSPPSEADGSCGGRGGPFATHVASSLAATSLGKRAAVALSRCGSALGPEANVGVDSTWSDEALFYGDAPEAKNAGSASPVSLEHGVGGGGVSGPTSAPPSPHSPIRRFGLAAEVDGSRHASFIEYDLGASAPQRIFTALLLLLDTSALPESLLQLCNLVAHVESSMDGQVYFSEAMVRVTGPVVVARWGSGPGSVTSFAARFWRLRFLTPVPAAIGVVRLFWMEAVPGSFAETPALAHTSVSPCLPVMLTMPPLPQQRQSSPADAALEAGWSTTSRGMPPALRDALIIEAKELLQPARQLISRDNLHPVFVDDASHAAGGWFAPHAVLPELGSAATPSCLFVCASAILRVCCGHRDNAVTTVQAESYLIVEHVGFRRLPYPFVLGWDAAFYTAPSRHPGRVAFLRGEWMLQWDLHEQRPLSEVVQWRTSALLGGLASVPIAVVVATVNCWLSGEGEAVIGVFHVASTFGEPEVRYVELNLTTGAVLDTPELLSSYLRRRFRATASASAAAGSTLHTVLCDPSAPATWHLFWDRGVQTVSPPTQGHVATDESESHEAAGGSDDDAAARPLAESRSFYSVPLYLREWGQPQHQCRILLDVPRLLTAVHGETGDSLLITGMQLCSSGGRAGERACWQVQCSADGCSGWRDVAMHRQTAGRRVCGETMWLPSDAYTLSKCPFWRISRVAEVEGGAGAAAAVASAASTERNCVASAQVYSQLRFLTVQRHRCRNVPERVCGAVQATTAEDLRAFFGGGSLGAAKLSLEPCHPSAAAAGEPAVDCVAYELLWDFGASPVSLCSVAFKFRDGAPAGHSCTCTMWCGDSPTNQEPCSTKMVHISDAGSGDGDVCTFAWLPDEMYRFWRLRCEWREVRHPAFGGPPVSPLVLSSFAAHEYDGPLLNLYDPHAGTRGATQLFWPTTPAKAVALYRFRCVINSVIVLARLKTDLTTWETEFHASSGSCSAHVAVEFSDDATRWQFAAHTTINTASATATRPQVCSLSWPSCGAHVLWRLRVLDASADVTLILTRVRLGHSPAETYISMCPPQHPSKRPVGAAPAPASVGHANADASTSMQAKTEAAMSLLTVGRPVRLVRVRAVLPSHTARYNVEYLGPDGVSWLTAAVLDGGSGACGTSGTGGSAAVTASVSWNSTRVSSSTHWRLRPIDGGSAEELRNVEWFSRSSEYWDMIDTSEVPGMVVSTTGFTEVQRLRLLSGSGVTAEPARAPRQPVLQCSLESWLDAGTLEAGVARPFASTVTWSFCAPLLFDELLLSVQSRAVSTDPGCSTTATDAAETEATGASAVLGSATSALPPPSTEPTSHDPICNVLVETSDNGEDFVVVSESGVRLCDRIVSLYCVGVAPSALWRVRVAPCGPPVAADDPVAPLPPPINVTVDVYTARWLVRRGGPALVSQLVKPLAGYCSTTIYHDWLHDVFGRESEFMRCCANAVDEYASTQSRLRESGDLSRLGEVAGAVDRLRTQYQTFLQKTTKDAARRMRLAGDAVPAAEDGNSPAPTPTAVAKAQASSTSRQPTEWITESRLSSDLIHLLMESAESPLVGGSHMARLVELMHHRLALRQAVYFVKNGARWFYPCLEAVGPLADDWYGFPAASCFASLSVFWSLSSPLQRQLGALLAGPGAMAPLSEHMASPLVVVQVNEANWLPQRHFPSAAVMLYSLGFQEQPVTVAFAVNDVVFTPPYALGVPGARDARPLLSPFPYKIATGVNFVQQRSLAKCPTPVLDTLRFVLPPSAFAVDSKGNPLVVTTMVLTVSGLRSGGGEAADADAALSGSGGILRFTVSGEGVNFGLANLVMDAIEFEVALGHDGAAGGELNLLTKQRFTRINFITHGARFTSSSGDTGARRELPVSLLGLVAGQGLPMVALRGFFGNHRFTEIAELPRAVVTHLHFRAFAYVAGGYAAQQQTSSTEDERGERGTGRWVCSPLDGDGQVFLPGVPRSCNCGCTVDAAQSEGGSQVRLTNFHIGLSGCSVEDLKLLCRACSSEERDTAPSQLSNLPRPGAACDLGGIRLQVAAALRVITGHVGDSRLHVSLKGSAVLYLENTVIPGASLEMDTNTRALSLMARCGHALQFGAVLVEGSPEQPILIQLVRAASTTAALPSSQSEQQPQQQSSGSATQDADPVAAAALRLLVSGQAHCFGSCHACCVTLEVAESTEALSSVTVVADSLRHHGLSLALQDSLVSEVWRYAQVTLDEAAVRRAIERGMEDVSIVAALQAHQIPLVLSIHSVVPEPYNLAALRLSCRVRGMLYGSSFDVMTSVVAPDDIDDLWSLLGAQCVPEIVEQCESSLWASYANVVGLLGAGHRHNVDSRAASR